MSTEKSETVHLSEVATWTENELPDLPDPVPDCIAFVISVPQPHIENGRFYRMWENWNRKTNPAR